MVGFMSAEGNWCVPNFNIGFKSFMKVLNASVCLHCYWCRKSEVDVWHMRCAAG